MHLPPIFSSVKKHIQFKVNTNEGDIFVTYSKWVQKGVPKL